LCRRCSHRKPLNIFPEKKSQILGSDTVVADERYGLVALWLHVFFNSATGKGELSALSPRRFIPEGITPALC
jgi:hypothetical protein